MDRQSTTGAPAGLLRRLAALFYDLLLVIALAMAATFAMLPLTHGQAILTRAQGLVGHAYHAALALLVFGYFGWSWTRTGQTLGMRAWRIRLAAAQGRRLNWPESLVRCLLGAGLVWMATLGAWYLRRPESPLAAAGAVALFVPLVLNYAWMSFDPEQRSLMDLAGRTRVLRSS